MRYVRMMIRAFNMLYKWEWDFLPFCFVEGGAAREIQHEDIGAIRSHGVAPSTYSTGYQGRQTEGVFGQRFVLSVYSKPRPEGKGQLRPQHAHRDQRYASKRNARINTESTRPLCVNALAVIANSRKHACVYMTAPEALYG